jgi:hypothetical protein
MRKPRNRVPVLDPDAGLAVGLACTRLAAELAVALFTVCGCMVACIAILLILTGGVGQAFESLGRFLYLSGESSRECFTCNIVSGLKVSS